MIGEQEQGYHAYVGEQKSDFGLQGGEHST